MLRLHGNAATLKIVEGCWKLIKNPKQTSKRKLKMQRCAKLHWDRYTVLRSNYSHDFLSSLKNLCLNQCIWCNALLECICSWYPSCIKVGEERAMVAYMLCTYFPQGMLTVFQSGAPFQFYFSVSLQESWAKDDM